MAFGSRWKLNTLATLSGQNGSRLASNGGNMVLSVRYVLTVLIGLILLVVATSVARAEIQLHSNGFAGETVKMSKAYACTRAGGRNQTPDLRVSGLPVGTSHLAIIMEYRRDKYVKKAKGVNWNVFNIEVADDNFRLNAGAKPLGLIGRNSKRIGYNGMCPSDGETRYYRLAVFALKAEASVDVSGFSAKAYSIEEFQEQFHNIILGKGILASYFR